MRTVQVVIFYAGLLSFLSAFFFIGADTGDTLWRIGVAAMLSVLVLTRLYPQKN